MNPRNAFDVYQERAADTDIYSPDLPDFVDPQELRLAMGAADEAGEVLGKYKKAIREDDPSYLEDVNAEIGDVLWYLARLSDERGVALSDIAEQNIGKLSDRKARGVIAGEGDHR